MDDEIDIIFETSLANFATIGRIFVLLANDFLDEFGSVDKFLRLRPREHRACLDGYENLLEENPGESEDFVMAVKLFSLFLESALNGDKKQARSILKRLAIEHNDTNRLTNNQLLGGLL